MPTSMRITDSDEVGAEKRSELFRLVVRFDLIPGREQRFDELMASDRSPNRSPACSCGDRDLPA